MPSDCREPSSTRLSSRFRAPRLCAVALTLLPLLSVGAPALGQPPDLVTDRPDQTESAATVPPNHYQIETGVLFISDEAAALETETTELLGTLVRVGLTERIELRVGFDGWISENLERRSGTSFQNEGFGDASVGAKLLWLEEGPGRPQTALLVESSVPIGDGEITTDDYEPSIRLAMSKGLSERVSLGWNGGVLFADDDETLFYTLVTGLSVDERNGVFIEVFGETNGGSSVDAGWTHLVTPTAQIDFAVGAGLRDAAPDWFVGMGVSLRFPN